MLGITFEEKKEQRASKLFQEIRVTEQILLSKTFPGAESVDLVDNTIKITWLLSYSSGHTTLHKLAIAQVWRSDGENSTISKRTDLSLPRRSSWRARVLADKKFRSKVTARFRVLMADRSQKNVPWWVKKSSNFMHNTENVTLYPIRRAFVDNMLAAQNGVFKFGSRRKS